jgi:hypothetical protein
LVGVCESIIVISLAIYLSACKGIESYKVSYVWQWRDRLTKALHSMNAGDVADQAVRQLDRAQRADRDRASKDPWTVKVIANLSSIIFGNLT